MDIFFETTLDDVVKLAPSEITSNKNKHILEFLKTTYEGTCSKFGYIKRNSIKLDNVFMGSVELATFHGYVLFPVSFTASICNPSVGSVIQCTVLRMNSFGMLCAAITKDLNTGKDEQIMNIAVPKHLSNKSESIMSNINVGENLYVEIIGKKYELKKTSINTT